MANTDQVLLHIGIVEDQHTFRKRLVELLGFYDHLNVSVASPSGEVFLERLAHLSPATYPDVVLMDIELPGMSGIETAWSVKEKYPKIDIVMVTVFEDDERIFDSIQVGATGYLLKDTAIDDLVDAITEISRGGSPISPGIARKVIQFIQQMDKDDIGLKAEHCAAPFDLTKAELRILRHVIAGKTNKTIAEDLYLSQWTVKTHIRNIYKKMQVSSRASAVRKAIKRNID